MDFLGTFYGSSKYANILLYGQEGVDYKVIDGIACRPDGGALSDLFLEKLCLSLFINVYPVEGENYINNRKDEFFSLYENMKLSPFIGFEPDTSKINSISIDMYEFIEKLGSCDIDKAIMEYREKLIEDGIEEYLKDVSEQWNTKGSKI